MSDIYAKTLRPTSYKTVDFTDLTATQLDGLLQADGKLHLFNGLIGPFGHRALWAAVEVGAPITDVIEINLGNPPPIYEEQFTRYGSSPFLLDNGQRIYESAIIAEYLDVKYGHGKLHRFEDPFESALAQLARDKVSPGPFYAFMQGRPGAEKSLRAHLTELEQIWRENAKAYRVKGPYLLGDKLSSAEINVIPFLFRFEVLLPHYQNGFQLLADYPLLNAALQAVKARPSFQETIREADFYIKGYEPWSKAP
ncbi:Aste57867_4170 [Aphanomyces stellatus]|uniref:Aste57867_4170 protein n=3 Tax=Aphanomyces stellatus TaxID=120398 RepID=A0A485KGJ8_9STRA|nr:hypothetical protein As57867_004159 [Aphanomyces stellatus]VFT81296.1 Aste57867_4170 [Aphanomyces stellatus]